MLARTLAHIAEQHGAEVEIRSLRVFAQMWALEANYLYRLLVPGLRPRALTLTIRHQDWWWWEDDEPLRFDSLWVESASRRLPPSVRELRIELESVQRKKDQVDEIARQMRERWFFRRQDDVVLFPDVEDKGIVDTWTGPSTVDGRAWTRDESRPGEIDYYILTVVFRPARVVERTGVVSPSARAVAAGGGFERSALVVARSSEEPQVDGGSDDGTGTDTDSEALESGSE